MRINRKAQEHTLYGIARMWEIHDHRKIRLSAALIL